MGRLHYTIPEDLHRAIKAKAATQGIFLKDFVIAALWAALDAPAPEPAEESVSTRKRGPAAKVAPKAPASAKTTNKPTTTVRKKAPPAR